MKKGIIWGAALIAAAVLFTASEVTAWDKNANAGWKSGAAVVPHLQNPKWLVTQGDPCGPVELPKTYDLEEGWGQSHTLWYEDGGNYNWILLVFETNETTWTSAVARFKAKVGSSQVVSLYAWSLGAWHHCRDNEGGNDPEVETDIDVSDYINTEPEGQYTWYRVILLMEGANATPNNEMWCDVCDMNVSN